MKKIAVLILLFVSMSVTIGAAATSVDPTGKTFKWAAPATVITADTTNAPAGYYLVRGTVSGTYTEQSAAISGLSAPSSIFTYAKGTVYYVAVKAFNSAGAGTASNEIIVSVPKTVVVPGAPDGLSCD